MEKQMLRCDICGGELEMQGGGKAVCASCGMKYSTESLREKFNGLKVSITGSRDDVAQWKELMNKYLEKHDYVAAEGIIKKILEADPTDQFANNLYDQMQDWKHLTIVNGILVSYGGKGEHLVLPKGIKEIGDEAFKESSIKHIEIQEGTERIGKRAFKGCKLLCEVELPDSLMIIDEEAFAECELIEDIYIPDLVSSLPCRCFSRCTSLKSIDLPDLIEGIGYECFIYCRSLTDIELPKSLIVIGSEAFKECISLSRIEFPDTLCELQGSAFYSSGLEEIRITEGIQKVGDLCFGFCQNLNRVYLEEENGIKQYGEGCFAGCKKLVSGVIATSNEWLIASYRTFEIDRQCSWYQGRTQISKTTVSVVYEPNNRKVELTEKGLQMKKNHEKAAWRKDKKCQYCGGEFVGIFSKTCSECGKQKDY